MEQSTAPASSVAEAMVSDPIVDQALRPESRRTIFFAFGFLAAGVAFTMSWVGLLAYGMVQFAVRVFPGG